jgi:hypothetical protein
MLLQVVWRNVTSRDESLNQRNLKERTCSSNNKSGTVQKSEDFVSSEAGGFKIKIPLRNNENHWMHNVVRTMWYDEESNPKTVNLRSIFQQPWICLERNGKEKGETNNCEVLLRKQITVKFRFHKVPKPSPLPTQELSRENKRIALRKKDVM